MTLNLKFINSGASRRKDYSCLGAIRGGRIDGGIYMVGMSICFGAIERYSPTINPNPTIILKMFTQ